MAACGSAGSSYGLTRDEFRCPSSGSPGALLRFMFSVMNGVPSEGQAYGSMVSDAALGPLLPHLLNGGIQNVSLFDFKMSKCCTLYLLVSSVDLATYGAYAHA